MRRSPTSSWPLIVALLAACSSTSAPSTSSAPTTTHPSSTTTPTTLPTLSVLEVRLTTASYSDTLVIEGDTVIYPNPFLDTPRTAELTPEAAATLAEWTSLAGAVAPEGVYNDARGLGESPFWEYTLSGSGTPFEFAFSWFPDGDLPGLRPMAEWVGLVRSAMVGCLPHRDLIERSGCERLLLADADQARVGDVVAGAPRVGGDAVGAWRRPDAVDADLAALVRQTLEPILRSDAFAGEITATVIAVRDDGGFYATAEDADYERVCFLRWTPQRPLSSCQRLLGDVFWAPDTFGEGHLELVMRPAERVRRTATLRYYQTLNGDEPREEAGLFAGEAWLFVIPDPPRWSLWVEVGDLPNTSTGWAMPSASICTAWGLDPVPTAQPGLPDAVAHTRSAVVAAAAICDSEALAALPGGTSLGGPMHRWYLQNDFVPVHDAAPWTVRLWPIVQMLGTDFAVIPGGTLSSQPDLLRILWAPILDDPTQDVFVWPAAAVYPTRAGTPSAQVQTASRINLEAVGRDGFVDGTYCGWSIGIRADGRVLWAGDCHDLLP